MKFDDPENLRKLERLHGILLDNFISLAEQNKLTPTDRRTLATLLKENGFLLDASRLPVEKRHKVTTETPPNYDDDDEPI